MKAYQTIRRSAPSLTKRVSSLSFSTFSLSGSMQCSKETNRNGQLMDVSELAENIRSSVREYSRHFQQQPIKLLGILAHDDLPFRSDAELYSARIHSTCQEDGLEYEICRVAGDQPKDVEDAIRAANARDDVHGILVYYPIFKQRKSWSRGPYKNQLTGVYYRTQDDYLRDVVSHSKDVEALGHMYNARWLFRAQGKNYTEQLSNVVYPCTPLSVLRILDCQGHQLAGKTITIVNRSEIFGRPLAAMLALRGATVYSIDEGSILQFRPGGRNRRCSDIDLDYCMIQSSIIVSAVPSPDFSLPMHAIQSGSTVVNVSEYANVDTEAVLNIPGTRFTPQVGKVTVAVLEQNLISLHQRLQHKINDQECAK